MHLHIMCFLSCFTATHIKHYATHIGNPSGRIVLEVVSGGPLLDVQWEGRVVVLCCGRSLQVFIVVSCGLPCTVPLSVRMLRD